MNPEQKQTIVDALQQTIDRIKNTKEDQKKLVYYYPLVSKNQMKVKICSRVLVY